MADNLISEIISEEAFKQVERLKVELAQNVELMDASVKSAVNLNAALKGASGAKEMADVLARQQAVTSELNVGLDGILRTHQRLLNTEKIAVDMKNRLNGSTKETIANMDKLAAAELKQARTAEVNLRIKERENKLNREVADGWKAILNELRAAENAYKAYAAAVRSGQEADSPQKRAELLSSYQKIRTYVDGVDKSLGNYQRNVGNYSSAMKGLGLQTMQLMREMPNLAMNAQTFILSLSNNLPYFFDALQAAKLEIAETNKAIKAAAVAAKEKAIADEIAAGASRKAAAAAGAQAEAQILANTQMQKAPSIWKMLGSSIFGVSGLLTIAVTLFTILAPKIIEWAKGLDFSTNAAKRAKLAQEALNKAYDDANYKNVIQNVAELRAELEMAKNGTLSKEKVMKHYNETIGKTTGAVGDLGEMESQLNKNAGKYIQLTLLKAQATVAFQQAAQKEVEAQKELSRDMSFWDKVTSTRSNLSAGEKLNLINGFWLGDRDKDKLLQSQSLLNKSLDRTRLENKNKLEKDAQSLIDIGTRFVNDAAKLAKDSGFDFFGGDFNQKNKNGRNENEKDETDDIIKNLELRAKKAIELNKFIFDTTGIEKYGLIAKQLQEKLENDIYAIRIQKKDLTKTELENLELEHQQKLAEISGEFLTAVDKQNKSRIEKEKQTQKELEALSKEQEENRQTSLIQAQERGLNASLEHIEDKRRSELTSLAKMYEEGEFKTEEYERRKKDISDKYDAESLEVRKKALLKILELGSLSPEKQKSIYDELLKLDKEYNDKTVRNAEEAAARKIKVQEKIQDLIIQLGNELTALGFDLAKANFERDKNELEQREKNIEERTKKEIEAINKTTLSEQEKADRITILNARAMSEKEEIARKQKELSVKQARWEKAQAVANIVQSTATAILGIWAQFPKADYGAAAAIATALVAALGAAQTARVLAQPIPQYKHGRKGGKAEIALVGEAGAERIEHRDGSSYIVDKPTITYLPEHAKVIPNWELQREQIQNAAKSSVYVTPSGKLVETNAMSTATLEKKLDTLNQSVQNSKTSFHIHRSWMGDAVTMNKMHDWYKWINDNI